MAIPQTKYVNIISAVGGQSQVSQRDLMGRIFTNNPLVPAGAIVEITGLDSVGSYFGIASNEYKFASKYFGYTSKSGTKPQKISFALHSNEAMPARLYGSVKASKLAELKEVVAGSMGIKIDGTSYTLTGLDFSSATSFADVASVVVSAIDGLGATSPATFEYDAVLSRFVLKSETDGEESSIDYATGDVATLLGLSAGNIGAIISDGSKAETGLEALSNSAELSNNFYSFTFFTDVASEEEDIAGWVLAQNVRYMWSLGVKSDNAISKATALKDYDGVGLSLGEDLVFLPMAISASINFDNVNATVDFMFQQAGGVETYVDTETERKAYDEARVNYYGTTQQAGQPISFYQDGKLLGSISSMGVYVNEAWLKDAIFTAVLNLRLSLDTLPATETGLAYVKSAIQSVIQKGIYNGVINAGKTLDETQKIYIAQLTGDKKAYLSVQSQGYWFDAEVVKYTEYGMDKYKVSYLLVYGKGDSINYVDGRDILI